MENLYFYPRLTEELRERAGFTVSPFVFSYFYNNEYVELIQKGKNTVKLEDSRESWKVETDGLHLKREIKVEYPEVLYGENGIACKEAILGICIIWTNKTLTQKSIILPTSESNLGATLHIVFEHDFMPGEIQGDLELETVIYIKKSAREVQQKEESLMNDSGVNVGVLDIFKIDFGSMYMDFPIHEVNSKQQPLWWLELGDWIDPRIDLFNEDNLCLYLNSSYNCCPKPGDTIKNMDVLIEIITTAYTMIFQKIIDMECLAHTVNDVDLEPGSISKIMFYFWSGCDTPIDTSSPERMHKTIWPNVETMINRGSEA